MTYVIREAVDADYDQLCRLYGLGDELHRENLPHIFQRFEGPVRDEEYLRSLVEGDDFGLFVAEAEEQLVGLVSVRASWTAPVPMLVRRGYAVVDILVVSEAFRRRGIGATLMERAHQWARGKGLDSVELTVWEFNTAAIQFYERLGYHTERRWMTRHLP
jgi:GNAT superfamily N-acetyltransferase